MKHCQCGCGRRTSPFRSGFRRFIQNHHVSRPASYWRSRAIGKFWTKVRKTATCWLWTGAKDAYGYGQIGVAGKVVYVHRFSVELAGRRIPKGKTVDHLCRTPLCVRPAHLEIVSRGENVLRGEGFAAKNARKTHCDRGHRFTADNIIWQGHWRSCKRCVYAARRRLCHSRSAA